MDAQGRATICLTTFLLYLFAKVITRRKGAIASSPFYPPFSID